MATAVRDLNKKMVKRHFAELDEWREEQKKNHGFTSATAKRTLAVEKEIPFQVFDDNYRGHDNFLPSNLQVDKSY